MPDHILSKTAEAVRTEKWRLRPLKKHAAEVELDEGEEALANVMGQHSQFLMEKLSELAKRVHQLEHKGRDE